MKRCLYCAEEIQEAATVCRYCGRNQDGTQQARKQFDPRSGVALVAGIVVAEVIVIFIRSIFWNNSYTTPGDMITEFYAYLVLAYAVGYFTAGLGAGLIASQHRAKLIGAWVGLLGFGYRLGHDLNAGIEITSDYLVIGTVAIGAGLLGSMLTGMQRQAATRSLNQSISAIAPAREGGRTDWTALILILLLISGVAALVWAASNGPMTSPPQSSASQPSNTPATRNTVVPGISRRTVSVVDGWKCIPSKARGEVVFSGQVMNNGTQPISVVQLRASLFDDQRQEVNSITGFADLPFCLRKGETAQFVLYVPDPQDLAKKCNIVIEKVSPALKTSARCPEGRPTNTPPISNPASSQNGGSVSQPNLLATMQRVRTNIQALAQDSEAVHCERDLPDSVLNNYESVVNAPKANVSEAARAAYNDYRTAVDIITRTNKDLYLHCQAWVDGTATSNVVSRQTWGTARQGVNEALQAIEAGIAKLK